MQQLQTVPTERSLKLRACFPLPDELDEHFHVFAIQRIFSFELFDTEARCAHDLLI